jgi:hypothetical protein
MMDISLLALAGWILAIEFALVACVLLIMLRRQSAKHSPVHSQPTLSNLMPDGKLVERLNTLEQQNIDVLEQLASMQRVLKQLQPQEHMPRRDGSAVTDPHDADSEWPTSLRQDNPDHDEESEELIDLFDEEQPPATQRNPRSR